MGVGTPPLVFFINVGILLQGLLLALGSHSPMADYLKYLQLIMIL
jgi:hypothetical protein